jgi:hypothetical protein
VEEIIVVFGSEICIRNTFAHLNDSNAVRAGYLAATFVNSIRIRMNVSTTQCETLNTNAVGANPRRSVQVGEAL